MAGQRGGPRPGSGRKPGASNKRTKEAVAKAQKAGKLPLDVMLEAMRAAYKKGGAAAAFDFAKDAAPYLHAKLSSIEATGKGGKDLMPPMITLVRDSSPDENQP